MPWKECDKVTERMKFIAKLLSGERMTDVCREFGISRVTGYKILRRYEDEGLTAASDRSKRPWRFAKATPVHVERVILETKNKYPTWGAPKILAHLQRKDRSLKLPAKSTVHAILDRNGFVIKRRRRRVHKLSGTLLTEAKAANDLWCADFKGHFRMGDNRLCYPLTITDQHSRYLLSCEALESTREVQAILCFKRVFKEFGLPHAIRTDNGIPFASRSIFGLSKLSVFWLRLGIRVEHIQPGCPQQNGRHERMHRTLKQAVTKPSGKNLLHQQEMFEDFIDVYNNERPHEALGMNCPSDYYVASRRVFSSNLEDYDYVSKGMISRHVSKCGQITLPKSKKLFVSDVFAGQLLGLKEEDEGIWSVHFMNYNLGFCSSDSRRLEPGPNPFFNYANQEL